MAVMYCMLIVMFTLLLSFFLSLVVFFDFVCGLVLKDGIKFDD